MMTGANPVLTDGDAAIGAAQVQFRDALMHSLESRTHIGEVEVAAAHFCQTLKRSGRTPEATLIVAKQVIHDALDGEAQAVAERAVESCIQHYFRE